MLTVVMQSAAESHAIVLILIARMGGRKNSFASFRWRKGDRRWILRIEN